MRKLRHTTKLQLIRQLPTTRLTQQLMPRLGQPRRNKLPKMPWEVLAREKTELRTRLQLPRSWKPILLLRLKLQLIMVLLTTLPLKLQLIMLLLTTIMLDTMSLLKLTTLLITLLLPITVTMLLITLLLMVTMLLLKLLLMVIMVSTELLKPVRTPEPPEFGVTDIPMPKKIQLEEEDSSTELRTD